VLAFMTFPRACAVDVDLLDQPAGASQRRDRAQNERGGIFPNDASITRLVGAMLEQNDEWSLNRRYMQLEGLQAVSDPVLTRLSAVAR
jgi:putative transposase